MSDPEYSAVWPGTYGHFVNVEHDGEADEPRDEGPSWADIALEQAIEEYLLKKAERKKK